MTPLPDVLDGLGLAITEVGGAQVAIESARLFWPSGELRVVVVVQAAWSGQVAVSLSLRGPTGAEVWTTKLAHAEVRRVRLARALPHGTEPLTLEVESSIPAGAERVRAPWIPGVVQGDPSESGSTVDALVGALRQAMGKRAAPAAARAPERATLPVRVAAVGGAARIAAQEEVIWQPGMADPTQVSGLQVEDLTAPPTLVSRAKGESHRPECPWCFTRAYLEEVRADHRCPSCGHMWQV